MGSLDNILRQTLTICFTTMLRRYGVAMLTYLLMTVSLHTLNAQIAAPSRIAQQGQVDFDFEIYNFPNEKNESVLSIYTRIAFSKLSFVKLDQLFIARFETVVTLLDENGRIVVERQKVDTIKTPSYEQTLTPQLTQPNLFSLITIVGEFNVLVQIIDSESGRTYKNQKPFLVKNFNAPYPTISTLMPAVILSDTTQKIRLIPSLNTLLQKGNPPIQFFYEVTTLKSETVYLNYLITQRTRTGSKEYQNTKRKLELQKGRTQFLDTLYSENFESGDYDLVIGVYNFEGRRVDESKMTFAVRLSGVNFSIKDIDKAIEQLRYIATGKDLDHIREATTNDEKIQRFNAYWKRFDPTPGTPENELMNEYYARVEFANQRFSNQGEGWRSDMGYIFIKYGQPDFVERQPQAFSNRNTEVWEYYTHRRRFVFVDLSGFNDYRLAIPEADSRTYTR